MPVQTADKTRPNAEVRFAITKTLVNSISSNTRLVLTGQVMLDSTSSQQNMSDTGLGIIQQAFTVEIKLPNK